MIDKIEIQQLARKGKKSEIGYKFISLFEKMPGNIYCPRFYILHHAVGCPYRCSYCFLQNTLRGQTYPRWYNNLDVMHKEVKDWLEKTKEPAALNCGELADSYAVSTEYIKIILPLFLAQEKHVVIFLTKSDNYPEDLLTPHKSVRLGWSINALEIARKFESNAPSAEGRLIAATKAKKAGFNVRVRIDPIIPAPQWKEYYRDIVQRVIALRPDFVTLRTLRAQGNLRMWAARGHALNTANPFAEVGDQMEKDGDDNAMRVKRAIRLEIYKELGGMLTEAGIQWGLCKEVTDLISELGKTNHRCNCLP